MPPRPRDHVARLSPYEWEAMASDVAHGAGILESEVIRFDTNTATWPPVAWEQTVLDVPRLSVNEYPHPSNEPLRSALARSLDVTPERVVVTCGADEALALVAQVYLGAGTLAVLADPTFSMFRVVSAAVGAGLVKVPVDDEWNVPLESVLEAVRDERVRVAWLCSPNNPTGRELPESLVAKVLAAAPDVAVVVDEAYCEISGHTLAPLILNAPNGILVRTFSKGYGLAGARVGYLAAAAEVTASIEAVRLPQNMTAFGIAAATRALADVDGLRARVNEIRVERLRLSEALQRRGWEVLPSAANFVLARPPVSAAAVAAWLQAGGLIVRSYAGHPRLNQWLRMTVRAPHEDDRLLARWDAYAGEG